MESDFAPPDVQLSSSYLSHILYIISSFSFPGGTNLSTLKSEILFYEKQQATHPIPLEVQLRFKPSFTILIFYDLLIRPRNSNNNSPWGVHFLSSYSAFRCLTKRHWEIKGRYQESAESTDCERLPCLLHFIHLPDTKSYLIKKTWLSFLQMDT